MDQIEDYGHGDYHEDFDYDYGSSLANNNYIDDDDIVPASDRPNDYMSGKKT